MRTFCTTPTQLRAYMDTKTFLSNIRDLIARDDLAAALLQLRALLENSPKLDETLLQSARFHDIRKQIRLGMVSHAEANLTQNQIRGGLLELLREIEASAGLSEGMTSSHPLTSQDIDRVTSSHPVNILREEMERAISIVNSKNVVIGSTITAGGNVEIGDRTIHTESDTSRRLRLFLYLFVPLLAIGGTFFWFRYQQMQQPLSLNVALDNQTPNPQLPFEGATATLQYGDESKTLPIRQEQEDANFKGIPANFRDEMVKLRFEAPGFVKIDTSFALSGNHLTLPIRRDDSYARIFGTVKDGQGNPLAGVKVRVQDLSDTTDAAGVFSLSIPFVKQRKEQRIEAFLQGFVPWDHTSPVVKNEEVSIILQLI